jgi:dsDNA-binding SOS-regulon protein
MFKFIRLSLRETTPHQDSKIDFIDGINCVRAANFQGKSTPFQLMSRLISGEMPYAASKKQKENKGVVQLSFQKGDIYYEVALNLSTNKYSIIENGRALEFKQPAALAKMDQILPFTLPALQNNMILSNDTFPYLLRGTPQQRKMLFEHLFDIDTDAQYKMFRAMSSDMGKLQAQREALAAIKHERVNPKAIDRQKKRITDLEKRLRRMEKIVSVNAEYNRAKRAWGEYSVDYPEIGKQKEPQLQARLKALDPEKLQQELEDAKVYIEYKQVKNYHDKMTKTANALAALLKKHKVNLPKIDVDWAELSIFIQINADYLNKHAQPPKGDSESLRDRMDELSAAQDKAERKIKALAHAKECPLCKTKLAGAAAKSVLKALQDEAADLQKQYADADANLKVMGKIGKMLRFLANHDISWNMARKLVPHVEAMRLHQRWLDAVAERDAIKLPVAPKTTPRDIAAIQQDLHHCMDERDAIRARLKLLDTPRMLESDTEEDVNNLRERISTLREQLSEDTVKLRKFLELQRDIARLSRKLYARPVVDSLKHLYGPKGLRLSRVRNALDAYIANLNKLAPMVFKGYTFSAEMSDIGIDLICKRPSGTSDVRRFSSSEGKLLPILSLLALHPLLPMHHRSNFLCLDEVEASLDDASRKKFTLLLPELQKHWPSLWILTPLNKQIFPVTGANVHNYSVQMDEDGVSTITRVN